MTFARGRGFLDLVRAACARVKRQPFGLEAVLYELDGAADRGDVGSALVRLAFEGELRRETRPWARGGALYARTGALQTARVDVFVARDAARRVAKVLDRWGRMEHRA